MSSTRGVYLPNMSRPNMGGTVNETEAAARPAATQPGGWSSVRLLLLLPFIGVLWSPSFGAVEPIFAGLPASTWYLLAWIVIAGGAVYTVYRAENA